jgi:hypothetical protein
MLDTSGNSRYREITINKKVFPFIGKIDWLELWRSIDENEEELFSQEDWDEHMETAESQRTQTYLDDFMNTSLYMSVDNAAPALAFSKPYSPTAIFKRFQEFNESLVGTYKLNPSKLAREISLAKFHGFIVEVDYMPSNPRMVKSLTMINNKKGIWGEVEGEQDGDGVIDDYQEVREKIVHLANKRGVGVVR